MQSKALAREESEGIKLPPPERRAPRRLVLNPERHRVAYDSREAKQRIDHFVKSARPTEGSRVDPAYEFHLGVLEKNLRDLESSLFEREESVQAREAHLTERERTLWESEALLHAREELLRVREQNIEAKPRVPLAVNPEEREALERLRREVAKQQESLEQQKSELKVREQFVEDCENTLLEKTMQQQEEESRLEQKTEELNARELRVNAFEGKPPPPEVPKEVL
jgi:DNA repair exonuclease SbcCD ATPase subunit